MLNIIDLFFDMLSSCYDVLNRIQFEVWGITVTWMHLLLSFAVLSMVITVFWKGAHK